jgi:hypothetical protein
MWQLKKGKKPFYLTFLFLMWLYFKKNLNSLLKYIFSGQLNINNMMIEKTGFFFPLKNFSNTKGCQFDC